MNNKEKVIREAIQSNNLVYIRLNNGELMECEPYSLVVTGMEERVLIFCKKEDFFRPLPLDSIEEVVTLEIGYVPKFKEYSDYKKWCLKTKVVQKVNFEVQKIRMKEL